jgi:flagellar biosynthesis/type III secretory pathway protein FliH
MSTIIKAVDPTRTVRGVAFNYEDVTAKAKQYLNEVRAEAARIVAEAQQEADQIRRHARDEGYRSGSEEIDRTVQDRLAERVAPLLSALGQAVDDVRHAKQAWLAHWEKSGVHLAARIAERLIRRELKQTPEITLTLVREALELAAGSTRLRIHINPADHETLGPHVESLIAEFSSLGPTKLIADPEITPGGCRIETRFGTIDQQFEAQLARIEEELG